MIFQNQIIFKFEIFEINMTFGGSCRDLRRYENDPKVKEIALKIITGKDHVVLPPEPPKCQNCKVVLKGDERFCPECGAKIGEQKKEEKPVVLLTSEEVEKKFKSGEEPEHKILAYLREMFNLSDAIAFDLVNKWREEMQPKEEKMDLDQFKG